MRVISVQNIILLASLLTVGVLTKAGGAIINVTTNDSYAKIEGANPGDQVLIAPGTYSFRLYLTKHATPTNPIVISAADPADPPVWDFGSTLVENAPGSYTAGDRGRGGWQFSGAQNYTVSGIVIRHARTASFNSAAVRYYNSSTNIYLKNCLFELNDDGLTGGTQDSHAIVEFCEFNANGNLSASSGSPTHNIYVYGGYLTLRYCYVHDSVQAQNFHIRCRQSVLEYNWFARAKNYEGDLMTDDDFSGTGPFQQSMTLRGNVFVQNALPGNHSQVVAMFNDAGLANLNLSLRMLYNTFIGVNTNAALVHVSNADGTTMNAEVSNNIIYGTRTPVLIENAAAATVSGINNWIQTNATAGPLTGSIQTASPGFRNLAGKDFTLAPGSACIGVANASVYGLPGREYYLNETTTRKWRARAAARDIGAFESTSTASAVGPYDPVPRPQLAISKQSTTDTLTWPLYAQEFVLEHVSGGNLANWATLSANYATNALGVSCTVPSSLSAEYFRLRK